MALAIIGPIALWIGWLMMQQQKKKQLRNQRLHELLREFRSGNGNGQEDFFSHRLIALDADTGRLLFVRMLPAGELAQVFSLDGIRSCRLDQRVTVVPATVKGKTEEHINSIWLELQRMDATTAGLCFYDEKDDDPMDLIAIRRLAAQWHQLISLQTRKTAPVT